MFDALALACAHEAHPQTITAIIRAESGGNPLAIHDNTTGRSYFAPTKQDAGRLLGSLLAQGHSVDAGLMQINNHNFLRYKLTPKNVFDECQNIRAGGEILLSAWQQAQNAGLTGQVALYHAVQSYNSGSLHGAPAYSRRVWQMAKAKPVTVAGYVPPANATGYAMQWSTQTVAWGN